MTSGSNWLAGNWWQILSALVLFASYVTVLAKAVQTVSQKAAISEPGNVGFDDCGLFGSK